MDNLNIAEIVDSIIGQSVNPRSIVFCLGSKISLHAGAPTLQEFIFKFQLGEIDWLKYSNEDLYEYATNKFGRASVVNTITNSTKGLSPTDFHYAIAESPINVVITTNFDTLLEQAMKQAGTDFNVVTYDTKILNIEKQKTIVKLSGTIDKPNTLVLTRLDQKEIKSRAELQSLVRSYLANNLVLFFGYDLREDLSNLYEKFGMEINLLNNWIVLSDKIGSLDESIWKRRGVKLIEINYSMLVPFINELSARVSKYNKRRLLQKRRRKIFIGGELKNEKLVRNIERYLTESGLYSVRLQDKPSEGKTLLEKFNSYVKEADAAIVIVDEDDSLFNTRGSNANLFFELGYLVSSLGQENVIIVQNSQQNLPTAFIGTEILIYDPDRPNMLSKKLDNWFKHL